MGYQEKHQARMNTTLTPAEIDRLEDLLGRGPLTKTEADTRLLELEWIQYYEMFDGVKDAVDVFQETRQDYSAYRRARGFNY